MINLLWGFWNGLTAIPLFIVQLFGGLEEFAVYDMMRADGWYQLGYFMGAGLLLCAVAGFRMGRGLRA